VNWKHETGRKRIIQGDIKQLENMSKVTHLAFEVNVNVKFTLYLNKHHAMRVYGRVEAQLQEFLISCRDGGSNPGLCISREQYRVSNGQGAG
jgi:hypothetical protein